MSKKVEYPGVFPSTYDESLTIHPYLLKASFVFPIFCNVVSSSLITSLLFIILHRPLVNELIFTTSVHYTPQLNSPLPR